MDKIIKIFDKADETKLVHSFQDACANKDFKAYISALNAKDELLMKFTSRLEDAFLESQNCASCKSLNTCKNKVPGYAYTPKVKEKIIDFSYEICKKQQKENERLAYQQNVTLFDLPKDIKEASFKDIYKDDKARVPIIKYFKDFAEEYEKTKTAKGLYLTGSFGSGKTYLISALFNELAKKNIRSASVYYPEFLRSLKSSFDSDYAERFNYIQKAPLLLLDDIGAENCSNWSRDEVLGPILQYRMDNHLPTFFTSNLTLEELEKSLAITSSGYDKVKARRIIERIKQLTTTLELVSKNRRN